MLPTSALDRGMLHVSVAADDPVRRADLAARVALAGHRLADSEAEADVVLADAASWMSTELPVLRLAEAALSPAQLDAALRAVSVGLRVSLPDSSPRVSLLTPRELEILACLGEGMSNKAVARRLGISAHTVKFHLEAVFTKLDVTSRAEAVAKGLRRGFILL